MNGTIKQYSHEKVKKNIVHNNSANLVFRRGPLRQFFTEAPLNVDNNYNYTSTVLQFEGLVRPGITFIRTHSSIYNFLLL